MTKDGKSDGKVQYGYAVNIKGVIMKNGISTKLVERLIKKRFKNVIEFIEIFRMDEIHITTWQKKYIQDIIIKEDM